jgi:hypothetical protein
VAASKEMRQQFGQYGDVVSFDFTFHLVKNKQTKGGKLNYFWGEVVANALYLLE